MAKPALMLYHKPILYRVILVLTVICHPSLCLSACLPVCQVCDEGHRLKAKGGNKTIDSLLALNCPKRIVLTGTPVQNNLVSAWMLQSTAQEYRRHAWAFGCRTSHTSCSFST